MTRAFQPLSLTATLVILVAACGDTPTAVPDPGGAALVRLDAEQRELLVEVRRATARYNAVGVALADGYTPAACHYSFAGGRGHLYTKAALVDGVVDPSTPEILNYEPTANGKLRLVGVTFKVPTATWDASNSSPPMLAGQAFHDPRTLGPFGPPPANYSLTVWAWDDNPLGMYNQYNPTVDCGSADATVFELQRATTVGESVFPLGNTAAGGQGTPIGGVSCIITTAPPAYHRHGHVSLFVDGEQIAIPAGIGVTPNPVLVNNYINFSPTKCFYELHTHDATGIVHLHANANNNRLLTLGQVFDVWGQPLTRSNVAGYIGPVTVYVDQQLYLGDPRAIVLMNFTQVNLQVGEPLDQPPTYLIPWNP